MRGPVCAGTTKTARDKEEFMKPKILAARLRTHQVQTPFLNFARKMLIVPALALLAAPAITSAQTYPTKTIRMLAPAAGGAADTAARLIAQGLTRSLGQQVIVDNRGGNGVIPAQVVAQAPADGYTLLFYGMTLWQLPFMQDNVPFNMERDFSPITLSTRTPLIVVVNPALPVKSTKELIALAKARPTQLIYGSAAPGGANHLAVELFKLMANVKVTHIPYKGVAPALVDLISGELQLMFPALSSGMPHVRSGKLRVLAITTDQPSELAPELPTVSSTLPGYDATYMTALLAPAKTPANVVDRLNQEVVSILKTVEVKQKLANLGIEAVGTTPAQLESTGKSEALKWGKVIKSAGVRAR